MYRSIQYRGLQGRAPVHTQVIVPIIAGQYDNNCHGSCIKKLVFVENLLDSLSGSCRFSCNHLTKEVIHVFH